MDKTGYQAATVEMMSRARRVPAGPLEPRGAKGEVGSIGKNAEKRNWKQCAWKNTTDVILVSIRCLKITVCYFSFYRSLLSFGMM